MSFALYAFGVVFVACDFGQRISDAFDENYDVICQYKWYLFSDQMKQLLPILLINVQEPVELQFFGTFSCSRETFKMVWLTVKFINKTKQIDLFNTISGA